MHIIYADDIRAIVILHLVKTVQQQRSHPIFGLDHIYSGSSGLEPPSKGGESRAMWLSLQPREDLKTPRKSGELNIQLPCQLLLHSYL